MGSVTTTVTIGDMNRSVRFPDELEARVRAEAVRLERSFNWVVVKALEKALSEAHGIVAREPAAPGPVGSQEPVRAAASPRASCECGSRSGKHELWCKGYGR